MWEQVRMKVGQESRPPGEGRGGERAGARVGGQAFCSQRTHPAGESGPDRSRRGLAAPAAERSSSSSVQLQRGAGRAGLGGGAFQGDGGQAVFKESRCPPGRQEVGSEKGVPVGRPPAAATPRGQATWCVRRRCAHLVGVSAGAEAARARRGRGGCPGVGRHAAGS